MELLFIGVLVLLMVWALTMGFPVGFALPGSAILTIALAGFSGYLFEGDSGAYFVQDGPVQWLSAGVTNFRSLYWDVERDTLIAIPLFVFMGIMLQRSKIAEDLLVTMAQLFGPVPGGLGISVVFVGALLAATTGIVGATVIAMGLISLPAMLRSNYSKPLATGTICASGTLGQIIPPSIVLIILADQLSNAADQASTLRKAEYKDATGEFTMPAEFDIVSASAGDMFMGAFIPGMVLVGIYMAYILVTAILRPESAPPVPYAGKYDWRFAVDVVLALVPPLTLIFAVLGSIILGVATVNQAGAIGAIGAMIMGGYRLTAGTRGAYWPAILALISIAMIMVVLNSYDLNIKNIRSSDDEEGLWLAAVAVVGFVIAIVWSAWRAYRVDDTLRGVMSETAKTTSMVFIILLGAAMLTSAFRGFGGEELVRDFLTELPGGFWGQFIVVMAVIFLLGFFLDFIEIAVVVVPIVAPILLANPEANVTAVWLGVMIGLNIQTSFLTPPFGFALFYLRGVAPPEVKTTQIYRGAVAFILLQLAGLTIAGTFPGLVNYLPNRTYLTSETAPPPMNPRLQLCLEEELFTHYDEHRAALEAAIAKASALDLSGLPDRYQEQLTDSFAQAGKTFSLVAAVREAESARLAYVSDYRPVRSEARGAQARVAEADAKLETLSVQLRRLTDDDADRSGDIAALKADIARWTAAKADAVAEVPGAWEESHARYRALSDAETRARRMYRNNVDDAYVGVRDFRAILSDNEKLQAAKPGLAAQVDAVNTLSPEAAMASIKSYERQLGAVNGASPIKSQVSKARRALRGNTPNAEKALAFLAKAKSRMETELAWRLAAAQSLSSALADYDRAIATSIGVRQQARLTPDHATSIAACQSVHRDISLNF